jgi:serine/threonine protein kinase
MIGRTLKHYAIESLLGQGGMGVVYLAKDTRLQRPVALKVLKPDLISNADRRKRFLLEARSAAALSHPAIAQIYDIDEDAGTLFICMEYVDGKTVSQLIANGELDLMGSVEIALQVAEGLARAHQQKIIHRDIKSDNIKVTRDGHAKLLDFGLAKLLEAYPEDAGDLPDISRTLTMEQAHTLAGAVMGTINYMSPEQARGKSLGPASDIFSLGVVLYEMVTGERPFKGETPLDTMHAIAFEEPKPVTIVRRNMPPQLHRIISRCLRKRPEDRYPDARALAADLKHLKHDLETGTRPSLAPVERLRGWAEWLRTSFPFGTWGLLVLAAVIVLMGVFIFTKLQWGNLVGMAFIAFFIYRAMRNRKMRKLTSFTKKIAADPVVRAVIIRDDLVTVVTDKASAKTYIRIAGLIDSINRRLYLAKHILVEIKADLSDEELQSLLRAPGVVYVRDDVPFVSRPPKR